MNLLFLVLLGLLMQATRSFSVTGSLATTSGVSLALGYMILTAFFAGAMVKGFRLPKLTGYLVSGMIVGPYALGLVTSRMVEQLTLVNGMAVALIALTAGSEMDLRRMRPLFRSVLAIGFIALPLTSILIAGAVMALRPYLPFFEGLTFPAALAVAAVLAAVITAQSPAVVIALRDELDADGPITRTVIGVVVVGDLLVILLFAATSAVAKSVLGSGAEGSVNLAWELLGSLTVGSAVGGVLALYLSRVRLGAELFLLMVAFVCAEIGARVHLDPLLLALAAGIVVRNFSAQGDLLHKCIEATALPVYLLFFATAGASIHLDVLGLVGIPAAILVAVRAFGLLGGTRIAANIAGSGDAIGKWAGFGLLPQAGLALALSLLFVKTFPEFGDHARALTLGIVALNELFAPIAYRWALVRAGEAGQKDVTQVHSELPQAQPRSSGA